MHERDTVVVGASAGGVAALCALARELPARLAATVLVVLHIGQHRSLLPTLLSGCGPLPARHAQDGEPLEPGQILVAPPDWHLVIAEGHAHLRQTPKEHFSRPAIDPLFRSAALERGPRVVGVLLSGWLDDGVAGLRAIKAAGGLVVVQDPDEAEASEMPSSALAAVAVDHCLRIHGIAALLARICGERGVGRPAPGASPRSGT